jgi:excisionase family DNA binding protein
MTRPDRLAYRVDEAAELASVSPRTIWSWITAGKLKTVKIGRCTLIPASSLRALLGEPS